MSFIITLYTQEGIVMASDSRLTLNVQQQTPQGEQTLLAAGMSDSNYKTFVTNNRIGISTFGQAQINGSPISGYIETFIREDVQKDISVTNFANDLKEHFRSYNPIPDVGFIVAGYEENGDGLKQMVFKVTPSNGSIEHVNPDRPDGAPSQGATWGGEGDILSRIVQPVFTKDENEKF